MAFLKILDPHGHKIPASQYMSSYGAYEAASSGRRMSTWGMSTAGPNAALFGSLATLRSRARELTRNDPLADGGMDTLAANLVGQGITPRWQLDDSELKKEVQLLWADWTKECDVTGMCDFYGLQALCTRAIIEGGEVFVRLRPRRRNAGLAVPFQLQVLEGDHLDAAYNTLAPNGNEIRMGIEFSKTGKRMAYWMFKEHPGESFLTSNNTERIRIPASEILHIYRLLRPGQIRGRPWLGAAIVTMHEANQFDDAEQVRKKGAAMFGGYITRPAGTGDYPSHLGRDGDNDAQGNKVIALEPGTFPELPSGYDVKFSDPADVGGNYEAFTKRNDRRAARGFGGLTYEKFTGDLADVNYSSIRSGNIEFQRVCKMIIYNTLVFQLCRPVAQAWMNQAMLSGALRISDFMANRRKYYRIKWCIDGWEWVDPEKDIKAETKAVRSGLKSRTESIAERGRDIEEVDEEIAADNKRADDLGLVLDTDPRKTDAGGKLKGKKKDDEEE